MDAPDDTRCRDARQLSRIDAAFTAGDLAALRAAVDDPSVVPNGPMPLAIGSCLSYAIAWSPFSFIEELLAIGADPNHDDGDGFPPVITALTKLTPHPGSMPRDDVGDVLRLLFAHGADPNQRGINDYTALHMAVAARSLEAVDILLDAGADPSLRTRIDDYETPGELARQAGFTEIAARLEQHKR